MIIGAIIVGILILALIILGEHISDRCGGDFEFGEFIGAVITILFVTEICLAEGVLHIADNFSNRKQCESSKVNTFIHEVVHGVLDTMGEFELSKNEKFVCTFSSFLVDTIEEIVKANNEHTIMRLQGVTAPLSDTNKTED